MNIYLTLGRIFFGVAIIGIGAMHFFHPGIRPIIIPELTTVPPFIGYAVGMLLIGAGLLIVIGKQVTTTTLSL